MSLANDFTTEAGARTGIEIYDTTLRDGTQGENISLSVEDKLKISRILDDLGVAYVEGGWPGSNPKDAEYFRRIGEVKLKTAKVAAFGMTCRVGSLPEQDESLHALIDCGAPVLTVVGKSSLFQVQEVLRTTPEENLRLIRASLAYLKGHGREIIYDAEHFFDGYRLDPEYAMQTLRAAAKGGADCLVLCDTNGGWLPWDLSAVVELVKAAFPGLRIGIHTHNDSELAVANTLAAVRAGATHVQGTINGYGERCGNANLCSVLVNLELKMGLPCLAEGALEQLTGTSLGVAETVNMAPHRGAAFVGQSAFAHKGGMHAAAVLRHPGSYEHIQPERVGNRRRILVSDLSGRGNLLSKAAEHDQALTSQEATQVVQSIKELEHRGFSFEGAEASVALLMRRRREDYRAPFRLIDLKVVVTSQPDSPMKSEATVRLEVQGRVRTSVAQGQGPVEALDAALRQGLLPLFPQLDKFRLADYKVRILDNQRACQATTRVLIDSQNGVRRWSTVGASANIIEASYQALVDSFEYGIDPGGQRASETEVCHGS